MKLRVTFSHLNEIMTRKTRPSNPRMKAHLTNGKICSAKSLLGILPSSCNFFEIYQCIVPEIIYKMLNTVLMIMQRFDLYDNIISYF